MIEIWEDIKDFEGYYKINENGNIKSLERVLRFGNNSRIKPEIILKTYINNSGYVSVDLYREGNVFKKKVSRLVALTFISNPDNLPEVNHIDLNKLNNHKTNLEWSSKSHNQKHAYKNGKLLTFCKKLSSSQVLEIRGLHSTGLYKQVELAEKFNIGNMQISRIINRKCWHEE